MRLEKWRSFRLPQYFDDSLHFADSFRRLDDPQRAGDRMASDLSPLCPVVCSIVTICVERAQRFSDRLSARSWASILSRWARRVNPLMGGLLEKMQYCGGLNLHIRCLGDGAPSMVLEAGAGRWSTHWTHVQTRISNHARICLRRRGDEVDRRPGGRRSQIQRPLRQR
ncbi:MAG TPA: hypothetical protein VE175_05475 [Woeseiaceae bacterium]|nr:hypothetical protein [Woeseiaceae bacterium]